ncbi:helix-turn-helix transcriptional regulator [Sandarakinorhabdus sp.]|uniref:response regulator transcription factor n=1 Tax=Sandarakinorhabdus sp. TaxID=1916663 RepID=UPI003341400E
MITQLNPEDPRRPRVSLLTQGERDCLRLVFQHMTSKDIARQLHVSHHAVDMRLRNAIRKLEVQNRIEAARMLVAVEGGMAASAASADYQALIYQAPELEDSGPTGEQQEPVSTNPGALPPRLNDPNLLEPGPLATAAHQMQFKPGVGPSGGFLAQPGAPTGNVTFGSTIATEWPGVAAPDPGDNARPFLATKPWGAKNELAIGHRLGWIMFIAFGSAMTFGGVLAAFAALKSLI